MSMKKKIFFHFINLAPLSTFTFRLMRFYFYFDFCPFYFRILLLFWYLIVGLFVVDFVQRFKINCLIVSIFFCFCFLFSVLLIFEIYLILFNIFLLYIYPAIWLLHKFVGWFWFKTLKTNKYIQQQILYSVIFRCNIYMYVCMYICYIVHKEQ